MWCSYREKKKYIDAIDNAHNIVKKIIEGNDNKKDLFAFLTDECKDSLNDIKRDKNKIEKLLYVIFEICDYENEDDKCRKTIKMGAKTFFNDVLNNNVLDFDISNLLETLCKAPPNKTDRKPKTLGKEIKS